MLIKRKPWFRVYLPKPPSRGQQEVQILLVLGKPGWIHSTHFVGLMLSLLCIESDFHSC